MKPDNFTVLTGILFIILPLAALSIDPGNKIFYFGIALGLFYNFLLFKLYKGKTTTRSIVSRLHADHILLGNDMILIQTGNIRMEIMTLAAGSFSFKVHYKIVLNIPAGCEKDDIRMTIGRISDELKSENLLISYNLFIDEGSRSQCVYPLALLIKGNISPKRFARLYNDLMKIVSDNQLSDREQFTIRGTNSGTIYRHYKGNLCVETIERESDRQLYFEASWDRPIFFGVGEDAFRAEQFNGLKDSCYDTDEDLDIKTTMKALKPILNNISNGLLATASKPHRNSIMVTLPHRGTTERVFITYNDGLWWVYANYGGSVSLSVSILSSQIL